MSMHSQLTILNGQILMVTDMEIMLMVQILMRFQVILSNGLMLMLMELGIILTVV